MRALPCDDCRERRCRMNGRCRCACHEGTRQRKGASQVATDTHKWDKFFQAWQLVSKAPHISCEELAAELGCRNRSDGMYWRNRLEDEAIIRVERGKVRRVDVLVKFTDRNVEKFKQRRGLLQQT